MGTRWTSAECTLEPFDLFNPYFLHHPNPKLSPLVKCLCTLRNWWLLFILIRNMMTSHLDTKAPPGTQCTNSIPAQGRSQENRSWHDTEQGGIFYLSDAFIRKKNGRFCLKQNCWQRNFSGNNASKAESGLGWPVDILPIYICRLVWMLVIARHY